MIFYSVILIIILLLSPVVTATHAATETELRARINDRNAQIEQLEKEIAAYQKTLAATADKSNTLKQEISRIETQIKKLNADIRLTESRIGATQLELEDIQGEITDTEYKIERGRRTLAATLKTIQEQDNESLMELMLKYERVSDFLNDLQHIENLEISIQETVAELREFKVMLEDERAKQEQRKQDLTALRGELRDRTSIEETARTSRATLLTATKNQETQYQKILAEREKQRELVLQEIQRIEDDLRKLINPADLPQARSGTLAWPVKGAILTQNFGNTPDAQILYNGKPHNGIDIKASIGTPVYASEAGVIRELGDTDAFSGCLSYGKWVLIEHPNNLSTLYAHLSLIRAQKGDTVTREQLIGYSGATGYATGPHLHFTVYDAKTVQFKSSTVPGSRCKFLPYGGYLNPMAYL